MHVHELAWTVGDLLMSCGPGAVSSVFTEYSNVKHMFPNDGYDQFRSRHGIYKHGNGPWTTY